MATWARWKVTEKRHAEFIEGERLGAHGHDLPDSVSGFIAVESKSKATVPQWLKDAVTQAVTNAINWRDRKKKDVSLFPVVLVHEVAAPYRSDLAVMRIEDFEWLMHRAGWRDGSEAMFMEEQDPDYPIRGSHWPESEEG